jgi:putative colanic acid biosynthesis acetyltransferase WcaF
MNKPVDLSSFRNKEFHPGKNIMVQLLWYAVNALFFKSYLLPVSAFKVIILRIFGAQVGAGVVIKPCVNIKYPWRLTIGDYCWIGEEVWIDNLVQVSLGNHVCLSQGSMLLTGNHNFKKTTFDLVTGEILIKNGAWIGAKSVVCGGVLVGNHAVLAVASVATQNLEPYGIYQGNPASLKKNRNIE